MLCGPQCKVNNSPNREEYHRIRFKEKMSFGNLSRLATERFQEQISAMSFHRHFTKHISPLETWKPSPEAEEHLEKKAKERLDTLDEIERNFVMLKRMTEEAMKLPMNAANINALAKLAAELRMTLQYISRHKETYMGTEKLSEGNVVAKIMDALSEIPEEYRKSVLAKLREEE